MEKSERKTQKHDQSNDGDGKIIPLRLFFEKLVLGRVLFKIEADHKIGQEGYIYRGEQSDIGSEIEIILQGIDENHFTGKIGQKKDRCEKVETQRGFLGQDEKESAGCDRDIDEIEKTFWNACVDGWQK
jgi:hypothetical protein